MKLARSAISDCLVVGLLSCGAVHCGNSATGDGGSAGSGSSQPTAGASTAAGSGNVAGSSVGTGGGSAGQGQMGMSGTNPGTGGSGVPTAGSGSGTGGAAPVGGSGTGGGAGPSGSCTFNISPAAMSSKIATVASVEFSTDLAGISKAQIEFGLDTNYGMIAPVDLMAAKYHTLLLGMKQRKTYHYRVVATGTSGECKSADQTVMTGSLPNGFPTITLNPKTATGLYGGFLLTGAYVSGGGGSGSPAFIADKDGEVVWAFNVGSDVTGARMSIDGKYMWINSAQVPQGKTNVHRVAMDGSTDENLSDQFTGLNHQLTVLPDESIAFFAYGSGGCDDVKIRHPDGKVDTLYNAGTATKGSMCHCNGIDYSDEDNSLVVSELDSQKYFKVKIADKSLTWVLGGTAPNDFTGDASTWTREHGVHVLSATRFVFFNNGAMGGGGSAAIEVLLDLGAKTATKAWSYKASPGIQNDIMGDVQRLKNGNTIVAYSTKGVVHEVDSMGKLLQEWTWPVGGAFGYIEKRASLYGAPER